jgi:hypothetical protein
MKEWDFRGEFAPTMEFEVSQDSVILIRLVYRDADASDGFPTITFDPLTVKVVAVYRGELY